VDARKGDGHERVSKRADLHRSGLHLALTARDEQAPRRRAKRDDPLTAFPLLPAPEEEARRAHVDPAEPAELDLEGALDAATPHRLRASFRLGHDRSVGG